jgi:hypothetical protein
MENYTAVLVLVLLTATAIVMSLITLVLTHTRTCEKFVEDEDIELSNSGSGLVKSVYSTTCQVGSTKETLGVLVAANLYDGSSEAEGVFSGVKPGEQVCYISHNDYVADLTKDCSKENGKLMVSGLVKDVRVDDLGENVGKRCAVVLDAASSSFNSFIDLLDVGDKTKAKLRSDKQEYEDKIVIYDQQTASLQKEKEGIDNEKSAVNTKIAIKTAEIASLNQSINSLDLQIATLNGTGFSVRHPDGRYWAIIGESDKIVLRTLTEAQPLKLYSHRALKTNRNVDVPIFKQKDGYWALTDSKEDTIGSSLALRHKDYNCYMQKAVGLKSIPNYWDVSWKIYIRNDIVTFLTDWHGYIIGYDSGRDHVCLITPGDKARTVDWRVCWGGECSNS